MTDHAGLPQPDEPEEIPPGHDKLLSCVCGVAGECADRRGSGHSGGSVG